MNWLGNRTSLAWLTLYSPWMPSFFFFSFSFNTPFTNYEASRRSFGISINNSVHSGQDKKVCVCVPVSEAGVKLLPFGLPYLKSGPGKHETAVVQGLEVQGEFWVSLLQEQSNLYGIMSNHGDADLWDSDTPGPVAKWSWPSCSLLFAQFQPLMKRQQINLKKK